MCTLISVVKCIITLGTKLQKGPTALKDYWEAWQVIDIYSIERLTISSMVTDSAKYLGVTRFSDDL